MPHEAAIQPPPRLRAVLLCLVLLCPILFCSDLSAQRYHTRTYDLSTGLPSVDLSAMVQDARGDLWITSRAGLIRYDGLHWNLHRATGRIASSAPQDCCLDAEGRVWTVSEKGLARFENGVWHALPTPETGFAPADLVLASTACEGRTQLLVASIDGSARLWKQDLWTDVPLRSADDADDSVHAVASTGTEFWIATQKALYRVDPASGTTRRHLAFRQGSPAYGLAYDATLDALWLIGPTWIGRLALRGPSGPADALEVLDEAPDLEVALRLEPHLEVQDDGRGGIWFGNSLTVYHLVEGKTLQRLDRSNGLIAEGLTALFKDREQNLWILSKRGMTKVISQRFRNYDIEQGLLHDEVTAICQLRDGTMALGHPGGLTFLHPTGIETVRIVTKSPKSRVMDLSLGPDGRLWIACDFVGVGVVSRPESPAGGKSVITWLPDPPNRRFSSICHDRKGTTWLGTTEGLYKIVDDKFVPVDLPPRRITNDTAVRRIVNGRDGSILFATTTFGAFGYRDGSLANWTTARGSTNTFTILQDASGKVWGGSIDGLLELRNGVLAPAESPRIDRAVYALLEDSKHRLWIGTDNGVHCWDGYTLEDFDSSSGLIGAEVNRAALTEDDQGNIWIGTDRGVSCYVRRLDTRVACRPIVRLTDLEVSGTSRSMSGPISLHANTRDLAFRFSVSSFMDEDGVRVRTKLENYDTDWSRPQVLPLREIRYTNIPAGSYRFHIQAVDVEGNESLEVVSPMVTIASAFYTRAWFLASASILLLGLIWAAFVFLNQRRYARDLETQIRVHTEQLRKAERTEAQVARLESLGALAGGIAHDFNNLLTAITGYNSLIGEMAQLDDQSAGFVKEVEKACNRAQSLTRQLLTFSTGGAPVREVTWISDIIRDATSFALMGSTVELELDVPEDLPAVEVDPGQFHQVLNNLIINARHEMPEGGKLRISARALPDPAQERQQVMVEVSDQGGGVPEEILQQIFDPYFTTKAQGSGLGLAIVHSIVSKHEGTIAVESNEWGGATFRISIPAADGVPDEAVQVPPRKMVTPCRILVMDDEAAIRRFVRLALEKLGCEVVEAVDGAGAIEAYEATSRTGETFTAVITDLTIPGGMGGMEAAKAIWEIDPTARIVVTSGYANEPILADHESLGFAGRLHKPFSVEELTRVLSSIQRTSRTTEV